MLTHGRGQDRHSHEPRDLDNKRNKQGFQDNILFCLQRHKIFIELRDSPEPPAEFEPKKEKTTDNKRYEHGRHDPFIGRVAKKPEGKRKCGHTQKNERYVSEVPVHEYRGECKTEL